MADNTYGQYNVLLSLADISSNAGLLYAPRVVPTNASGVAQAAGSLTDPMAMGGLVNSTLPTYTAGTEAPFSLTVKGAAVVSIGDTTGNLATTVSPSADNASAVRGVAVVAENLKFNGGGYDRDRKPNIFARIASSSASGNPAFLKSSAGDFTKASGLTGATATYLQIYNKASAPTIGTDTPVLVFYLTPNVAFDIQIPNGGAYLSTGIAYAFTTDAAGTTAAAAAAVTAVAIFGA